MLIVFSDVSIKAYAIDLPSDGHFMTASETLSFIGDSLDVTYYDGSDYRTTTALYQSTLTHSLTEVSENPVGFVSAAGVPWLVYTFNPVSINTSPNYITVQLNPTYSIFDTEFLYTCVALSAGSSTPSSIYTSPSCDWYIGGSVTHFANTQNSTSNSGKKAYLYDNSTFGKIYDGQFTYVPVVHSSASSFSAYCMSCDFNGNSYGRTLVYYFLVMCPYVSGSASGGSGTFVSGSGGGDINVDIDMSETNGILGRIENIMGGLVDGIKGLFIPSEEDITDFKTDISDLLTDTFSGYSEASDYMDQVSDVLISSHPSAVLEFPALSVPGTSFVTPAKSIDLNFDSGIIETVKYIIDIIATICVLNLIMDKVKAVLVGEKVVEVEGLEDDY